MGTSQGYHLRVKAIPEVEGEKKSPLSERTIIKTTLGIGPSFGRRAQPAEFCSLMSAKKLTTLPTPLSGANKIAKLHMQLKPWPSRGCAKIGVDQHRQQCGGASDESAISIKRDFLPFGNQVSYRSPLKPYG